MLLSMNIFGGKKSNTELTETEREEVEMMMLMEEEYYPTDETNFELQDSSKNSASNGGYIDL